MSRMVVKIIVDVPDNNDVGKRDGFIWGVIRLFTITFPGFKVIENESPVTVIFNKENDET